MASKRLRSRSLRVRLAVGLAASLAVLWIGASLVAGHVLRHETDEVFDSALREMAQRILPLAYEQLLADAEARWRAGHPGSTDFTPIPTGIGGPTGLVGAPVGVPVDVSDDPDAFDAVVTSIHGHTHDHGHDHPRDHDHPHDGHDHHEDAQPRPVVVDPDDEPPA